MREKISYAIYVDIFVILCALALFIMQLLCIKKEHRMKLLKTTKKQRKFKSMKQQQSNSHNNYETQSILTGEEITVPTRQKRCQERQSS